MKVSHLEFVCFLAYFPKVASGGHAGVVANSVNPGIVNTEVLRHYPFLMRCLFNFIGFFFFKASITRSNGAKLQTARIVPGCFHKVPCVSYVCTHVFQIC